MLGAHEAENLGQIARPDEMLEQRALGLRGYLVRELRYGVRRGIALGDFDQLRRVQQLIGELLDFAGERRREQQVLALRCHGQERHDPLDVRDEAHVEHPVGLVQHEDLDLPQVNALLLDVVEQSSWRGDENLDAAAHNRQLLLDVHAAVDDGRAQVRVLAVRAEGFLDLHREFAGWREDQRAHRVPRRRMVRVRHRRQFLQDRQGEAGGLAGAGLGAAHDILAGENDGDRLHLDRRRCRIAGFLHGPQ